MKNELVSKEIAILAKEKGFDGFTAPFCYHEDSGAWANTVDVVKSKRVFAPTRTYIQDWLRKRGVEVWAAPYTYKEETDGTYTGFVYNNGKLVDDTVDFPTFQEAFDCALIEGLKRLKNDIDLWERLVNRV